MDARLAADGAMEQVFLERVERAERLVALQRRRVLQLEALGLDLAQAQALLQLMESVAEQFHVAWRLFCTYGGPALPVKSRIAARWVDGVASALDGSPATACVRKARVPCPRCGLMLHLEGEDGALVYDMNEWAQRCRNPALQTPVLCQLLAQERPTVH